MTSTVLGVFRLFWKEDTDEWVKSNGEGQKGFRYRNHGGGHESFEGVAGKGSCKSFPSFKQMR